MEALLTIEEAQARILERVRPLRGERVSLDDALGRVVAEEARALVDLPPFPSSAMDGFAVRAADTPGRLPVVARVAAGVPVASPLGSAEAMGIATGGVVPEGADTVVAVEDVVENDNTIEIVARLQVGTNIRTRGGDVRAGAAIVRRGTRLGSPQLGALAAAGIAFVHCAVRPRVALLSTGSELRRPGEPLGAGEIYEANGVLLAAQLTQAGATVVRLPQVADDEDVHREAIQQGLGADVLVTSGGVSVGPHDLVRRIERELGVEEVFWGVAVKPGKPIAFGTRGATLVFGLPGNPVSSLVAFELFVRLALLGLQGAADPRPRFHSGVLARPARRNPQRTELARARTARHARGVAVELLTGQESHMIARAAEADALALIPQGDGELAAGESVDYLLLA